MPPNAFIDRSTAIPEASSIAIQRLDGGWIIKTSICDVPLACRTALDVLNVVRLFVSDTAPMPELEQFGDESMIGSQCAISRIDRGTLLTILYAPGHNSQFVRFLPREVVLVVVQWLGLRPVAPTEPIQPPPSDGGIHQ